MEKIINYIKREWQIIILFSLGFISLAWFRGKYIIDTLDFAFPYNRIFYFNRLFYIWNDSNSLGFLDSRIFANLVPYGIYQYILNTFHVSLYLGELLFTFICISGSSLSMYYLCQKLKFGANVSFLSGLLYVANPFAMTFIWPMRSLFILSYAFIPLSIGHFISISDQKISWRNIVLHCLLLFFTLTSSFSNPAIFVIYFFPVLFYIILKFLKDRTTKYIILFSKITILFFSLSLFWILPFAHSFSIEFQNASPKILQENDLQTLNLSSKNTFESFSLTGFWALTSQYKDDLYFPWYKHFQTPLGNSLQFLPFLGLIVYIISGKNRKNKIFLLILVLLSLLILTGTKSLFSNEKQFLFTKLPLLARTFRNLETKISPILLIGFIPAASAGLLFLLKKNRFIKYPILILLIFYFGYLNSAIFTGEVIGDRGIVTPSTRVQVPDYYSEARAFFSKDNSNYKIIGLPLSTVYLTALDWPSGFVGTNPDRYLFNHSTLTNNTGENYIIPSLIAAKATIDTDDLEQMKKLAGMANVKYIVLHNDTNWNYIFNNKYWIQTSPEIFSTIESETDPIRIGKLSIIKTDDQYLNNLFYLTQRTVIYETDSSVKTILDAFTTSKFYEPKSAFISSKDLNNKSFETENNTIHADVLWDGQLRNSQFSSEMLSSLYYLDVPYLVNIESRYTNNEYIINLNRSIPQITISASIGGEPVETKEIKIKPNSNDDVYITFDKEKIYKLSKTPGISEIGVFPIDPKNSLDVDFFSAPQNFIGVPNGSFESGAWTDFPDDCSIDRSGNADFEQKILKNNNNHFLELTSRNHLACTSQTIQTQKQFDSLWITFNFRTIKGGGGQFCLWNNDSGECTIHDNLPISQDWTSYSNFLPNQSTNNHYSFYIYSEEGEINQFDNISVVGLNHIGSQRITFEKNGWIDFTNIQAKEIAIQATAQKNLVPNGSFNDNGSWNQNINDCSINKIGAPEISMQKVFDSADGGMAVLIKTNNHLACISTLLDDYRPNIDYSLTLDYKHISGENPRICIWESVIKKCLVDESISDNQATILDNGWLRWKKNFTSNNIASTAYIYLYAPYQTQPTEILFSSVRIQPNLIKPENYILLIQGNSTTSTASGEVTFTKINPTLYKLVLKSSRKAEDLVFNESFSSSWNLRVPTHEKWLFKNYISNSSIQHFKANGYANLWHINLKELCAKEFCEEKDGVYTLNLILEFEPQRWFYVGLVISGTTLALCLGYLGWDFVRRRRVSSKELQEKNTEAPDRVLAMTQQTKRGNGRNSRNKKIKHGNSRF